MFPGCVSGDNHRQGITYTFIDQELRNSLPSSALASLSFENSPGIPPERAFQLIIDITYIANGGCPVACLYIANRLSPGMQTILLPHRF
jgi:hypothetical protein